MVAYDYKKECKELYLPDTSPVLVKVPRLNYLAVRGKGDPNEKGGAYKASIKNLYSIMYTIKMSKFGKNHIDGYFDFVVPPLEGFWKQDGASGSGFDYSRKNDFDSKRCHHEIYISDPRKIALFEMKTVIRHPIKSCKGVISYVSENDESGNGRTAQACVCYRN